MDSCAEIVVTSGVVKIQSALHELVSENFSKVNVWWQRERVVHEIALAFGNEGNAIGTLGTVGFVQDLAT